jgi:hypothetical protein
LLTAPGPLLQAQCCAIFAGGVSLTLSTRTTAPGRRPAAGNGPRVPAGGEGGTARTGRTGQPAFVGLRKRSCCRSWAWHPVGSRRAAPPVSGRWKPRKPTRRLRHFVPGAGGQRESRTVEPSHVVPSKSRVACGKRLLDPQGGSSLKGDTLTPLPRQYLGSGRVKHRVDARNDELLRCILTSRDGLPRCDSIPGSGGSSL